MFKTTIYTKLALLLLLLSASLIVRSQPTGWTLEKAIDEAIKNRKALSKAKSEIIISQLKTWELHAKYRPTVSAEYTYRYNAIVPTSVMPASVFNPGSADKNIAFKMGTDYSQRAGITVEQPVFNASFARLIDESKLGEELAVLAEKDAELTIAYETAKAYLNVLATGQQLQQAASDTARTAITLQAVQQKFDNQRTLKTDVNDARVAHNNNVQAYFTVGSNLLVQKQYLLYLTGNDLQLAGGLSLAPYQLAENMVATANDEALLQLPQIALLKTNNKLLDAKAATERAKHLPTFGLAGFLGGDQYADRLNPFKSNSWFGNSYVGINLKIPVLFGENTGKRIGQLKIQQQQNNFQIEENINKLKYDAAAALEHYRNAQSRINALEANIVLTKEALEIYTERFRNDQFNAYELNVRETSLQKMTRELAQLQSEKVSFWLDWLKATGGIGRLF